MAKLSFSGKDLLKMGFPEGPVIGLIINLLPKHYKRNTQAEAETLLEAILANPADYAEDAVLGRIAEALVGSQQEEKIPIPLLTKGVPYEIYGAENIEKGAISQMEVAARLPISRAAALMPDAHQGYGLPIGGVLATENAVIPFGVGMDIGCRMCLSVYALNPHELKAKSDFFKKALRDNTRFGFEHFKDPMEDAVLERSEFREIQRLKGLHSKAAQQIGSSGSGNHFVEFGMVDITDPSNEMGLAIGQYVGLLSHSGSRGIGANIAQYYTDLAMEQCVLPKEAKHLAWLDLDSEAGQEYWLAMNLAGDYAAACHHHIHRRLSREIGETALAVVENHHNFAWKETLEDGKEYIVHRKGATPAGKGVLGVIPGSMTAPAYIVRGKGKTASLNSAAHGAGRQMSRKQAFKSITHSELKKMLQSHGVELIGGGLDEAPIAYKNIDQVMAAQQDLVDVLGSFLPKIVRMDG